MSHIIKLIFILDYSDTKHTYNSLLRKVLLTANKRKDAGITSLT